MMKSEPTFFEKVYEITQQIPPGRVSTYGAIARYLGLGKSARMVGWALNASNQLPHFVPAHRVVNRKGLLTGKHHFRNENLMQELLESEGIKVVNDQVIHFSSHFWDPNKELF